MLLKLCKKWVSYKDVKTGEEKKFNVYWLEDEKTEMKIFIKPNVFESAEGLVVTKNRDLLNAFAERID